MAKESFMKLPEEKKAQILEIAAEEFIRCGFDGASTNTITQRAGISKGLLFHYFGSKKELHLHILQGMLDRFAEASERQTSEITGTTLYENMAALFRSKAGYMNQYALDLEFMEKAHREQSPEVRDDIFRIYAAVAGTMQRQRQELVRRSIIGGRLRDGVTEAQATECVLLSLDALSNRFSALYKVKGMELLTNPALILDTMKLYLDVVCRGLYTE